MQSEFVKIYNEELSILRKEGASFAEAHPKIASRLKLGQGSVEDPFVGRLLESFAFLTSKSKYQLQEEIEKLDCNLIQLIYPHYFLPIPGCSILRFVPVDDLDHMQNISAQTTLSSDLNDQPIFFNTVYSVMVRPLKLESLHYRREIMVSAQSREITGFKSCLTMTLECTKEGLSYSALNLSSLRFFINSTSEISGLLYELLMTSCGAISLQVNKQTFQIPLTQLKPVGFELDESLIPYPENSFSGYRLLSEYFAYPEKFLFFDLDLKTCALLSSQEKCETPLQINFYFNQYYPDLEKYIDHTSLLLHCTPIVNLFKKIGVPIEFDHRKQNHHLVVDEKLGVESCEVYEVSKLSVSSVEYNEVIDCMPYFGRKFKDHNQKSLYWQITRKSCDSIGLHNIPGDEIFINFSDFNLEDEMESLVLTPYLLCTNRDLPRRLPFGGGKPHWRFEKGQPDFIQKAECVKKITASQYRQASSQRMRLSQHIYLNQIGYSDHESTLENLKSILAIYRFSEDQDKLIGGGFLEATASPITLRHPNPFQQGFCRGIDYKIKVDETYFPHQDVYLLGSILREFLTKSCSINSFVTLSLESLQRGALFQWKPKLGIKPIL